MFSTNVNHNIEIITQIIQTDCTKKHFLRTTLSSLCKLVCKNRNFF